MQVRTSLQHEWAEIFEKLADLVGRGIRYGDPPSHWLSEAERDRQPLPLRRLYEVSYRQRETVVHLALVTAGLVDVVEQGEQEAPDDPVLSDYRQQVADAIAHLRGAVDDLK